MQALTGERLVSPVSIPPQAIQDLRGLFSTYRLYQKQNTQLKNRIHSLLRSGCTDLRRKNYLTREAGSG
ncbi:MAG: hypothetical protein LBF87_01200, partial [Treponema sp.]|jgi:hypothetical protein|nr:hypothetical protein [Treponema sp.]